LPLTAPLSAAQLGGKALVTRGDVTANKKLITK